jgi:hypothetical protein
LTREEHTKLIREIRNSLNDEGKVTDLLTQLSDDYEATLTTVENVQSDAEAIRKANESLRDTNMRLFLKVGSDPKDEPPVEETEELSSEELLKDALGAFM